MNDMQENQEEQEYYFIYCNIDFWEFPIVLGKLYMGVAQQYNTGKIEQKPHKFTKDEMLSYLYKNYLSFLVTKLNNQERGITVKYYKNGKYVKNIKYEDLKITLEIK